MKVCAIVPAFDEAGRIGSVVVGLRRHVAQVVVVDDGSGDRSAEEAAAAGATVLRHDRNRGKGAALRTGVEFALQDGFDAVLTCDGDGQHDPRDVPHLLAGALASDADIVLGTRTLNVDTVPLTRRFTNRASSRLVSLIARRTVRDSQCGFRLLRTRMLRRVPIRGDRYDAESDLLLAALRRGHSLHEVPVRTIYGVASKFRPVSDTWRILKVLLREAI
ncbi:MAG: glycosyltransferase family 2 protein [Planctomycetes bacterium]|nr:glycosyltransferase family 2 protein [Planctomycetota bacterium]